MGTYYVSGTVLGTTVTSVNDYINPYPCEAYILEETDKYLFSLNDHTSIEKKHIRGIWTDKERGEHLNQMDQKRLPEKKSFKEIPKELHLKAVEISHENI